ncbi:MAG: hypothetical protein IEMM0008_1601 [bacterium]|nr:MAG: hypothetical protein IEMM0008_1601 [bacterium]
MKTFKGLMLTLFSGSIILILALSNGYTVVYRKGNRLNVLASSLNMRAQPSIKAKKVRKIPYGARVIVLEKTKSAFKSEGIKGHWVKVKYGKRIGYVFDGYLTKRPVPPKNCKGLKHYADSKLGKIGKKPKKIYERHKGTDAYNAKYVQHYKQNSAKIEIEEGYEWYSVALTLKNISVEEAFLIARMCGKFYSAEHFRNKPYILNAKGQLKIIEEGYMALGLTIHKTLKGYVKITYKN